MLDADKMNEQKKEMIWQQWQIGSPMILIGRSSGEPILSSPLKIRFAFFQKRSYAFLFVFGLH